MDKKVSELNSAVADDDSWLCGWQTVETLGLFSLQVSLVQCQLVCSGTSLPMCILQMYLVVGTPRRARITMSNPRDRDRALLLLEDAQIAADYATGHRLLMKPPCCLGDSDS